MNARIEAAFQRAGVTGHLHAVDLDTGREIGLRAGEAVVIASVFKLPLLVAFYRRAAAGLLDPAEPVVVRADPRSGGSTGVSVFQDEARVSLRDLAALMITISDNTAADALFARVGTAEVNAAMADLGLRDTHIVGDCADLAQSMLADSGASDLDSLWALLAEPGMAARLRALDPARTSRSTPRDLTRLLSAVWRDEVPAGPEIRRLLGLQVWPHRLASGFPFDDVRVSGKTGTMLTIRNEVGLVEYPDGGRYAVAVCTRSATVAAVQPAADAVIGTAARLAVDALRLG